MIPFPTIQNISLEQIDFDDFSYSISVERQTDIDEKLKKSIARHGILHPPIIRESDTGFYAIVSGWKRLLAARSLHTEDVCSCLIISRQVPEVDVFHILLEEIQLTRQFTPIEKAMFLQKISAITDEKYVAKELLPRLGLPPAPFAMHQILLLLNLEEPILRAVNRGDIGETVARDILVLSARDRMILFAIISGLRLSFSNQKKLLTMCRELASRGNANIAALLDNEEVHCILQHQDANPPQKTKNLMTWLSCKHMERSRQAEEEFSRFLSAMQLPQNVSVAHTPFFEDDVMTLSITYPNRKSLQHAWEKIRHGTPDNSD